MKLAYVGAAIAIALIISGLNFAYIHDTVTWFVDGAVYIAVKMTTEREGRVLLGIMLFMICLLRYLYCKGEAEIRKNADGMHKRDVFAGS